MSYYLGPGRPLTALNTWEEVEAAGSAGLLGEHQWVELKKALGPSKPQVNTELAKDMASLALDGGLLIYGVDNDGQPVGCDASTLPQRVSQVAAMGITPPLSPVIHDPVPVPTEEGKSVVIIQVPPSAVAPHMVDGRYWGRSSDGKRVLGDAEVRRLIEARDRGQADFEKRFGGLVEQDPLVPLLAGPPMNGHFYFLAEPLGSVPSSGEVSNDLVLRELIRKLPHGNTAWATGLEVCTRQAHDPDGTALMYGDREVEARNEKWLTYLSVKDDRRVVIVGGGATAEMPSGPRDEGTSYVLDGLVSWLTVQGLELVRALALERWGYLGEWRVGIHLTGLAGKTTSNQGRRWGGAVSFSSPHYSRIATASPGAWLTDIPATADELLSGLFRGLGYPGTTVETILHT